MADSQAVFAERVQQLKLGAFADRMKELVFTTHGVFVFVAPYNLGSQDESELVKRAVVPILGDADHQLRPALRRLFFESYAAAAADVQRRLASRAEDRGRRMTAAEREQRFKATQKKLPNMELRGHLEPAHLLVGAYLDMGETRAHCDTFFGAYVRLGTRKQSG